MVLADQPESSEPGPGEALVAVRRVGICGTDFHAFCGRQNFFAYPRILGHELAVEVLAVGPEVSTVKSGDLCAVMPYVSCGACSACCRGRRNCCERISVLGVTADGGMRERMVVPADQLFRGEGLTLDQLVLVETLGIGWHAVTRGNPEPGDTVLVLGAGPIGLAIASAAQPRVARVLLADIAPERVEFARGRGLDAILLGDDAPAQVAAADSGALPTMVLDASGSRQSMERAFELTASSGTLVFVGHTTGTVTFQNPLFHARELDIRASRNATLDDWTEVIDAVRSGMLDAVGWINHRSTLAGIVDELPQLVSHPGPVVKAVVSVGGDGPEG
jgi:threonine dehydrogenase-like Zn-dependent dehydrogenase